MQSSTALYRQYRPQRFDDVVGQPAAVRTLRNAIRQGRVAHAYLFTGTKGTGKTTLAKILARAMNCVNGPTEEPCGVCEACVSISEGRSMDVAEIDAASNRGIDDVRDKIIDTVAYQPSTGTRRVYILDEAHQLTPAAFNALLKTIEEPPPHVLFVFCTTELHQMMATVRDRCQRIVLGSPGPDALVEVLSSVCAEEQIDADEPALRAIARAAQGSFRNALGTLELLTTTFDRSFTRDDVLAQLGTVGEEALFDIADAVIDADAAAALRQVEGLMQEGVDLDQFARALAEHLRGVLLARHGLAASSGVVDEARLAEQARRSDEQRVLAAIDCIADAVTRIRVGSDERIAVETALVRACQGLGLPLLALRLATLEQQVTGSYGAPLPSPKSDRSVEDAGRAPRPAPAAAPPDAAAAVTTPTPVSPPASPDSVPAPPDAPASMAPTSEAAPTGDQQPPMPDTALANVDAWWPQVLARLSVSAPLRPVAAVLGITEADEHRVMLYLTRALPMTDGTRTAISDAVLAVTGHRLAIDVGSPADDARVARAAAEPTRTSADPSVEAPAEAVPSTTSRSERSAAAPAPSLPAGDPDHLGVQNLISLFDAAPVPGPGGGGAPD